MSLPVATWSRCLVHVFPDPGKLARAVVGKVPFLEEVELRRTFDIWLWCRDTWPTNGVLTMPTLRAHCPIFIDKDSTLFIGISSRICEQAFICCNVVRHFSCKIRVYDGVSFQGRILNSLMMETEFCLNENDYDWHNYTRYNPYVYWLSHSDKKIQEQHAVQTLRVGYSGPFGCR